MNFFSSIYDAIATMLAQAWFFFVNGGWAVVLIALTYMMQRLYMQKINGDFIGSTDWVDLHIKVEKENLQSLLAVEQIFAQLHALQANMTWAEMHLEGKVQLWISCEIVSIGGKISYIVRCPRKNMGLIVTSFYAQFPNAEITEVEDYMKNLQHWDGEKSNWDMWGTEFKMLREDGYPIKTWRDFEHANAEEPMIDPLAGMLEALSRVESHELMSVQFCMRPIPDKDWQPKSEELVKKLKGEPVAKKLSILQKIFHPINIAGQKTIIETVFGDSGKPSADEKAPLALRLSEGERNVIAGIERKMSRPGWQVKIRVLYIAPKDRFDGSKRGPLIGGFRIFSGMTTNGVKPDIAGTWTSYNYRLSKNLERPYIEYVTEHKKELFLKGFVGRSMWVGVKPMVLSGEELASIYHFPLATTSTPPVERIDIKKGQPPKDLPIF